MKKKLMVLSGLVLGLAPVVAFAQSAGCAGFGGAAGQSWAGTGTSNTLFFIICKLEGLLGAIIPLIIALGLIYFIWGVITYVIASDEEAKKTGRNRIIYGIIGLVVIVSVWGLVRILANTFGISGENTVPFPTITITGGGTN